MSQKLYLLLLPMIFMMGGCFWPWKVAAPGLFEEKRAQQAHSASRQAQGEISVEFVGPGLLPSNGRIHVDLFKAGSDAEAGAVLDHVSEVVFQGATDGLTGNLSWESSSLQEADVALKGHIEQFKVARTFKWIFLPGRKEATLKVRAELKNRNGELIALVYGWKKVPYTQDSVELAAYSIGGAIVKGLFEK